MEALEAILVDLGLHSAFSKFQENKVGPKEVLLLTDEEFKNLGITAIGDKARLRQRCRVEISSRPEGFQSPVLQVFSALRSQKQSKPPLKKKKSTRKIYVGWKHKINGSYFQQVPLSKGGGSLHIDFEKHTDLNSLTEEIKKLFFPNGRAELKNLNANQCSFSLANFNGKKIEWKLDNGEEFTVENYFQVIKSTPLRIYLHTEMSMSNETSVDKANTLTQSSIITTNQESEIEEYSCSSGAPSLFTDNANQQSSVSSDVDDDYFNFGGQCGTDARESMASLSDYEDYDSKDIECSSGTPTIIFNMKKHSSQHSANSVYDILTKIRSNLVVDRTNSFNINRNDVLDGARRALQRRSFNPFYKMSVKFADDYGVSEGAVDEGGPKRELLTLLLSEVQRSTIFEGSPSSRILTHNAAALNDGLYKDIGKIMALSIVHGGPAPQFLSPITFYELTGQKSRVQQRLCLEDIGDKDIKQKLEKLELADDISDVPTILDELDVILSVSGCWRPVFNVKQKDNLLSDIITFLVITRNQQAYMQFSEGLECLGILSEMKMYPDTMSVLFLKDDDDKLDAKKMESLFELPKLSLKGSNNLLVEQRIISFWRDFLLDVEEEEADLNLSDILMFATGADRIPPLGFEPRPSLKIMLGDCKFPKANTCAMELSLPPSMTYNDFKTNVIFGIKNAYGFGDA